MFVLALLLLGYDLGLVGFFTQIIVMYFNKYDVM